MRAVRIVNAGVHSFFRISRQIAPVCELILGCQILVSNFIYCTHADTNTQNLVNHFETNVLSNCSMQYLKDVTRVFLV